jgi:uncharacterized protein YndB with AHSA1/START domain
MTTPQPTGRLVSHDDGIYVVFDRIFSASIEDVWASLTRKDRLETWIGTWTGQATTGAIKFLMNAEESTDWEDVTILECDAPHRFEGDIGQGSESRRVFFHLTEATSHTTLTFGQRLHSPKNQADIGVGWDYYLDRLIASRAHKPLPVWGDYYPTLVKFYQNLATEFNTH